MSLTLEESLYAYLKDYAGLKSLVSDRIYPDRLPPGTTDASVVFEMVSGPRYHAMGKDVSLTSPRYLFYCWGTSKSSAVSVAKQVRAALQDYSSAAMGGTGGVTVQHIYLEDEYDGEDAWEGRENPLMPSDTGGLAKSRVLEFIIWYEE